LKQLSVTFAHKKRQVKGALIPDTAKKSIVPSYIQMYGAIQQRESVWEWRFNGDKERLGRYGGLGLCS
jgi:hypothetical protein